MPDDKTKKERKLDICSPELNAAKEVKDAFIKILDYYVAQTEGVKI